MFVVRTNMYLRSGAVVGAHILRPEHRPAFEEGVRQVFIRWTALCLAVENQWGGLRSKEKADGLMQEVLEWFYRKKGGRSWQACTFCLFMSLLLSFSRALC